VIAGKFKIADDGMVHSPIARMTKSHMSPRFINLTDTLCCIGLAKTVYLHHI